jgi:type III secretion system YscQ/HrcQ family protein
MGLSTATIRQGRQKKTIVTPVSRLRPFTFDRLTCLTSAQAALLDGASRWLAGRREWSCAELAEVVGHPLAISAGALRPSRRPRQAGEGSELIIIEHAASGERLLVEVDALLGLELVWSSLADVLDLSVPTPRPLSQVERGVLLYVASRVLWSLWGQASPFRLVGFVDERDDVELSEGVTLHLTVQGGPIQGHAWLHLGPGLRRLLPDHGVDSDLRRLPTLPTTLHVVIGAALLSAAQWRQVEHGDAIMLDTSPRPLAGEVEARGPVWLRLPAGRPRWSAFFDGAGTLQVEAASTHHEGTAMEQADDRLPQDSGELLEEIPAEISVELGRVPLNAKEALELRPGQTLRLDRHPGDPVELRIGPKLIGRGELVQIDGRIGVVLRELFESD